MAEYEPLVPMFEKMAELAAILRKKRMKRGSIDFDFPETKVILDKNGNPVDIRPYDRNVATKLIEDFMLAANETVAAEYYWRELPFVYQKYHFFVEIFIFFNIMFPFVFSSSAFVLYCTIISLSRMHLAPSAIFHTPLQPLPSSSPIISMI